MSFFVMEDLRDFYGPVTESVNIGKQTFVGECRREVKFGSVPPGDDGCWGAAR